MQDGIWAALGAGGISVCWRFWSHAAEVSLLLVFFVTGGGLLPDKSLYFGHCVAQFKRVVVGWC